MMGGEQESGGSSGGGAAEGERNGNRWPRQETVALIKIRTDMDLVFQTSTLKGPLWDDVSRKLAELGYHRSAKKCKEKFENVFKYHKRTKDGRATKSEGKTYRFFEQLEALDNLLPQPPPPPRPQTHQAATSATPLSIAMPVTNPSIGPPFSTTVSSAQIVQHPTNVPQIVASTNSFPSSTLPPQSYPFSMSFSAPIPPSNQNPSLVSSSSSTSSDEEPERRGNKRKRKWGDFFQRLTNEVMEKQEKMHKKFLEALEERERDRLAREEAWRVQEMARISREREILAQERAASAAKDAAMFAFLQKVSASDQQTLNPYTSQTAQKNNLATTPPPTEQVRQTMQPQTIQRPPPSVPTPVQHTPPPSQQIQESPAAMPTPIQKTPPPIQQVPQPQPVPSPQPSQLPLHTHSLVQSTRNEPNTDNGGEIVNFKYPNPSPSRWPKAEIEALIKLRTNLDLKYQENVPKGPLWEDISAAMLRLGYNRNAKRCKEKWENINKYYKKVKESNKKRPEDSKTCPYFSQLDAIYKDRAKSDAHSKEEHAATPIMAEPEQQWPVHNRPELLLMEGHGSDDDMDMDDDEDEEDEAGNFELVANKPSPVGTAE